MSIVNSQILAKDAPLATIVSTSSPCEEGASDVIEPSGSERRNVLGMLFTVTLCTCAPRRCKPNRVLHSKGSVPSSFAIPRNPPLKRSVVKKEG